MANPDSDDYCDQFIGKIERGYFTLGYSSCLELFCEAWRCYKEAEAYQATCILCRASIEAILFCTLTMDVLHNLPMRYGTNPSDYLKLEKLISQAKREHLLDGLESKVENIKKDGDFGAHLVQKITQQLAGIKPEPFATKAKISPLTVGKGKGTARQRILDTAEVILHVIHKRPPPELPYSSYGRNWANRVKEEKKDDARQAPSK